MNLHDIEAELLQELDALALDETVLLDSEESCLDHYLNLDSHRPISTTTFDESENLSATIYDHDWHDSLHPSAYFSWIESVPMNSGDIDLLSTLTEEIETEAEAERLLIQQRRAQAKREREIQASIERVHYLHMSDSASRLQMVVKGFLSRRRTERKQRLRKGILKWSNIADNIQRKRAHLIWIEYIRQQNSVNRITKWIMNMKSYQILRKVSMYIGFETICTLWRRRIIRMMMQHWYDKIRFLRQQEAVILRTNHSAIRIQSITRMHGSIKVALQKSLAKQNAAATVIQSLTRGSQARQLRHLLLCQIHIQKANAAIKLQSFFRCKMTRRRFIKVVQQSLQAHTDLDEAFNVEKDEVDRLLNDFDDMMQEEPDTAIGWQPKLPPVQTRQISSNKSTNLDEERLGKTSSPYTNPVTDEWNISERVYQVGRIISSYSFID